MNKQRKKISRFPGLALLTALILSRFTHCGWIDDRLRDFTNWEGIGGDSGETHGTFDFGTDMYAVGQLVRFHYQSGDELVTGRVTKIHDMDDTTGIDLDGDTLPEFLYGATREIDRDENDELYNIPFFLNFDPGTGEVFSDPGLEGEFSFQYSGESNIIFVTDGADHGGREYTLAGDRVGANFLINGLWDWENNQVIGFNNGYLVAGLNKYSHFGSAPAGQLEINTNGLINALRLPEGFVLQYLDQDSTENKLVAVDNSLSIVNTIPMNNCSSRPALTKMDDLLYLGCVSSGNDLIALSSFFDLAGNSSDSDNFGFTYYGSAVARTTVNPIFTYNSDTADPLVIYNPDRFPFYYSPNIFTNSGDRALVVEPPAGDHYFMGMVNGGIFTTQSQPRLVDFTGDGSQYLPGHTLSLDNARAESFSAAGSQDNEAYFAFARFHPDFGRDVLTVVIANEERGTREFTVGALPDTGGQIQTRILSPDENEVAVVACVDSSSCQLFWSTDAGESWQGTFVDYGVSAMDLTWEKGKYTFLAGYPGSTGTFIHFYPFTLPPQWGRD